MTINCHITIPAPFIDEIEGLAWQSFVRDRYLDVPGAREVVIVTTTEAHLQSAMNQYPQVKLLEKHQQNGLRAGLVLTVDESGNQIITGLPNYTPDKTTLENSLKDKVVGGSPVSRALDDDDTLRLFGWAKRDYIT